MAKKKAQAMISYLLVLIMIISILTISLVFARTTLKESQDKKRLNTVELNFHEINQLIQDSAREQSKKGPYEFFLEDDEDLIITTNKIEFIKRNSQSNYANFYQDSLSKIGSNSNRVVLEYKDPTADNCYGIQLKNTLSLSKNTYNNIYLSYKQENITTSPCSETIYQIIEVKSYEI